MHAPDHQGSTMSEIDDRIPHPTHIGLNIAKAIPQDRPDADADGNLQPHPDPDKVAAPVLEILPPDAPLPSTEYLDQIAVEAGDTLAGVWETSPEATIRWVRETMRTGLDEH